MLQYHKSLSLWGHFLVYMRKTAYKSCLIMFFDNVTMQNVFCEGLCLGIRLRDRIYSLYSIKIIVSMESPYKT